MNLSDIRFPLEFPLASLAYPYALGICSPLDAHAARMGPVFREAVFIPIGLAVFGGAISSVLLSNLQPAIEALLGAFMSRKDGVFSILIPPYFVALLNHKGQSPFGSSGAGTSFGFRVECFPAKIVQPFPSAIHLMRLILRSTGRLSDP